MNYRFETVEQVLEVKYFVNNVLSKAQQKRNFLLYESEHSFIYHNYTD
jgi:hypothetical protein